MGVKTVYSKRRNLYDSAMNGKYILIYLISGLLLWGLACKSPFSTREPEPPDDDSSARFIDASLPEVVFENLEYAFADRNVENYIRSFVDSTRSQLRFLFLPDQSVAANHPGVFLNWLIENERRYMEQLLQVVPSDSALSLLFLNKTQQSPTVNDVTFDVDYIIIARHTKQDVNIPENLPVVMKGNAKFRLAKNQTGTWEIYRWEDFSNSTDPSWSELKAALR